MKRPTSMLRYELEVEVVGLRDEVARLRGIEEACRAALDEMRREWRTHRDQGYAAPHSSRTLGRATGFAVSADLLATALTDSNGGEACPDCHGTGWDQRPNVLTAVFCPRGCPDPRVALTDSNEGE